MPVQIQLRHDPAANWTAANPTLALGEVGLETDTVKFKVGDGATAWSSLAYGIQGDPGSPGADGADGVGIPVGGTTAQRLAKIDGTDYNTEWVTPSDGISEITTIPTAETDDTLVLAPDGAGGVEFRAVAGGGGGGVTVDDEGTPLATAATTIDFVGAGVTASGTGATKTITIPGGSNALAFVYLATIAR